MDSCLLVVRRVADVLAELPEGDAWLSPVERARLGTMQHPRRRAQFRAGHALARRLLARTAGRGEEWRRWSLDCGEHGAPLPRRDGQPAGLHVSLAHSGEFVACAVSRQPLGVDIECVPRRRDLLQLARSLYPAAFVAELAACDEAERRARFHRRWVLDEAHAKSDGRGLLRTELRARDWLPGASAGATGLSWDLDCGWLALVLLAVAEHPVAVPTPELPEGMGAGPVRGWRIQQR